MANSENYVLEEFKREKKKEREVKKENIWASFRVHEPLKTENSVLKRTQRDGYKGEKCQLRMILHSVLRRDLKERNMRSEYVLFLVLHYIFPL